MPVEVMSRAPDIVPVLVIPPELLLIPFVTDSPLDAVNSPAEVIVPDPDVYILLEEEIVPEVERLPFSSIVNLVFPPDWIANAVWFDAALISFIINAEAVPELVSTNDVVRLFPRVNSIFLFAVVVIVLPTS